MAWWILRILGLKARDLLLRTSDETGRLVDGPLAGSFLLVDEFQDTNELQCSILGGLGADRVLMVGDERQSIYRFRGADVDVFTKRRAALEREVGGSQAGGLHRLDINYRSSPEILHFINSLFSHQDFFGEDFARLSPDPARAPSPSGRRRLRRLYPVEVLVAERGPADEAGERLVSSRQAEAEALAGHVRGLVDREGWSQRDIVVLLPTQIQVEVYRAALIGQGLDVYVVRGKGYYAQEEVTDITSLLQMLVAPHDDLALLSVLRSPLVAASDDALYLLGRERRRRHARSLWEVMRGEPVDALDRADSEALERLVQKLDGLRARVGRPGLSRLIDDAVSAFSYDLCLLSAPEGMRRFANMRKLMRLG